MVGGPGNIEGIGRLPKEARQWSVTQTMQLGKEWVSNEHSTILACQQRAIGSKAMERRVSAVILNVYQSTGIEKEDGSRQSLESHRKLDEIRRFYNKKFAEKHDGRVLETQ